MGRSIEHEDVHAVVPAHKDGHKGSIHPRGRVTSATSGWLVAVALFVGGCAWVALEPEAQAVGVRRSEAETADCKKRGTIEANTRARIGFIARNETKVAVELERLARNRAVSLGANTIVPLAPMTADGERSYAAYLCPEDD